MIKIKKTRLANGKLVPTIKEIQFAKEYVASNGNGSASARKAYNIKPNDIKTPSSIATDNLAKPRIQELIKALLPTEEEEAQVIKDALHAKTDKDTISWSDKHAYLQTSLKIKGILDNKDKESSTQVAFIIQNN